MSNDIPIQQGFSDELRSSAAELYDAAFGAKLALAIPSPRLRKDLLREGFCPEHSLVAVRDGTLVGIAGFKTELGSLTGGITFRLLVQKLGTLNAVRAYLVLSLFHRRQSAHQLLMDGISVSPSMRGSGVGTTLLLSLVEHARREGYRSVRLDVIDTNAAARRLYERVGFVPVKTQQFAYLRWLLGFGAATQMEYSLATNA